MLDIEAIQVGHIVRCDNGEGWYNFETGKTYPITQINDREIWIDGVHVSKSSSHLAADFTNLNTIKHIGLEHASKPRNRVKLRNGERCISLGDMISCNRAWWNLNIYNQVTGQRDDDPRFDIMAVYGPAAHVMGSLDPTVHGPLLWERVEKTPQQIEYEALMEKIAELQQQAEKLQKHLQ